MSTSFPIPYPGQTPDSELARVTALLKVLSVAATGADNKLRELDYGHVAAVLDEAVDIIVPVADFLNGLDIPGCSEKFAAHRRAWIVENGGQS